MGKIVKVGVVGVDSGQIMIADPCYLDSEWKKDGDDVSCVPPQIYRDKTTGKTYAYAGFPVPEGMKVDVKFADWMSPLEDYQGATPNTVREAGSWEKVEIPEEHNLAGKFCYSGICYTTLQNPGFGQLNYEMGHAGAGVASRTLIGDGCYPVFAKLDDDGGVEGLAIDFRVADYDGAIEYEEIAGILSDPTLKTANGSSRSCREIREMIVERQSPGIWPAIRRLVEGADILEPLLDDMAVPLEGIQDTLQDGAVSSAKATILAIRTLSAQMEEISKDLVELVEASESKSIDELKPLDDEVEDDK
jgi:hypothetical protein